MSLSFIDIVRKFQDHSLDKSLWTHQAHITTAIWYLIHHDREDALCRIRSGIISYNLATGGENTGSNGYHETITVYWWRLIDLYIKTHEGLEYDQLCESFLASPYAGQSKAFEFYSKEKLLSAQARACYLAPDIKEVCL